MIAANTIATALIPVVSTLKVTKIHKDMAPTTFVSYCPKTGMVSLRLTFASYEMKLVPGLSMRKARNLIEEAHGEFADSAYEFLYLGREHQCPTTKLYCWYPEESDTCYY